MQEGWSREDEHLLQDLLKRLVQEERWDQVRLIARQITVLHPDDAEAWFWLGAAWLELKNADKAEACFRQSLEMGGDQLKNICRMSGLCMHRGDLEGAIQWCHKALKIDPENSEVLLRLAKAHKSKGESVEALKALEGLLELQPGHIEARELLASVYVSFHLCDRAAEQLRKALELDSSQAHLWIKLGHCLANIDNPSEALEAFCKAVEIEPNNENYLHNLGNAYLGIGLPEKASVLLNKVVRINDNLALAWYDLGMAFFEMLKYEDGAAAFKRAIQLDKEIETRGLMEVSATENLGLCLMNAGRFDEALDCFKRNLIINGRTYYNLGLTLFKMKKYDESLSNFMKSLETDPDNVECLDMLGCTYLELGRLAEAREALQHAVDINPEHAFARYDLGVVLSKVNSQQELALNHLNHAVKLNPGFAWAYYALARIYALQGKKDLALESIETALVKGWDDFEHLDRDADLESVRGDKAFQLLVQKYRKQQSV